MKKKDTTKNLESYFNNAIYELTKLGEKELTDKIISVKDDLFRIKDSYNDKTAAKWEDVDNRLKELSIEYEKYSSSNDMKVVSFCFNHAKKAIIFERRLIQLLGLKEGENWESEDLRNAIFIVLKSYRKDIKARRDEALLRKYDLLKNNVKKVVTGKFNDTKMKLFELLEIEMRADVWKDDEDMKFLDHAMHLHNQLSFSEMAKDIVGRIGMKHADK